VWGTFNLESANNQANTRLLSSAVEPLEPSRPKVRTGIIASIFGGLLVGLLAALGWEMLDRRVRSPQDLMVVPGVPVLGVLRTKGHRRTGFNRLLALPGPGTPSTALIAGPGGHA